ncbi:MAG: tetratricopeptide repeat protein [Armatimonadetes bacterium]|nr:tetratricopeptide repeat protein [Armatimonadota bacterium]
MPECPSCGKQAETGANFCSRCGARIAEAEAPNPSLEGLIADFRSRLPDAPQNADLHYNLALAYSRQGSLGLAIEEMKIVIRLSPDFAEAFYQLGLLYRQSGGREEARAAFRQAIEIEADPRYSVFLNSDF